MNKLLSLKAEGTVAESQGHLQSHHGPVPSDKAAWSREHIHAGLRAGCGVAGVPAHQRLLPQPSFPASMDHSHPQGFYPREHQTHVMSKQANLSLSSGKQREPEVFIHNI